MKKMKKMNMTIPSEYIKENTKFRIETKTNCGDTLKIKKEINFRKFCY